MIQPTADWGRVVEVRRRKKRDLLTEIHFENRITLMVKEACSYREAALHRFATSRAAARVLRKRKILAPEYIEMEREEPALIYRRIDVPTLDDVWEELTVQERADALRDLGRLVRRMHDVRLTGCGPLYPHEERPATLEAFLRADLETRLRPAVIAEWPDGLPTLERLIEAIPMISDRRYDSALLHNDLHLGNVLCEIEPVQCLGFLDLEDVMVGPPEIDFARLDILLGPIYRNLLGGRSFDRVWEGYGRPLDPILLTYFRSWHLINLGYYSATTGDPAHASLLLEAADYERPRKYHLEDHRRPQRKSLQSPAATAYLRSSTETFRATRI